jgi:hypothetical protein
MAQETVVKSIQKYPFRMSNTEITTWTSSKQGYVVTGKTSFALNVTATSEDTVSATNAGSYIVPDFTQTLVGTLILDQNAPVVELKKVSIEEAKHIIYQYLKQHPASRTSDLIIELALEPDIVIEALSQLRCEGKVEGKDVDHK